MTPEIKRAKQYLELQASELPNWARQLLDYISGLERAAQAVVDLDDGDKPDLWHFQTEFQALRDALECKQRRPD